MKQKILAGVVAACTAVLFLAFQTARAADHGDAPTASNNASTDINDVYLFLDPNDNNRVILEMTTRGFIVPSEAVNFGIFDPKLVYRLSLEGTGDVIPDARIDITFTPRTTSGAGQTATIRMDQGPTKVFEFTAPATNPSVNASPPTQVVTTDPASGVTFFAGEADDPFFFDIPAFSRFVAAVRAGTPNPAAAFIRGRDSFAGYNTMSIALSVPKLLLPNASGVIGVYGATLRVEPQFASALGNLATRGQVSGGSKVLIGGLIISGTGAKRVVVRGIGPSLAASNVPGPLPDPTLKLFNSQAQLVASNDNWQDTQAAAITGTGLAPQNAKESAILVTLQPGAYTVILDDATGASGIGVVEGYDLDVSA